MLPSHPGWDEDDALTNHDVLLSCSLEAGTSRRKPGRTMSVWLSRHVRRAIWTITGMLIFIYLQRNGVGCGQLAPVYYGIIT
jgi:hypothetical protein